MKTTVGRADFGSRSEAIRAAMHVAWALGRDAKRFEDSLILASKASEIGYPVLIKASAGGGGKGMRKVDHPDQFKDALSSARRKAKAAFGDERVLVEK